MKTRLVIGKKIKSVRQERTTTNADRTVFDVQWIELEDGTKIIFTVYPTENDYAIGAQVIAPQKRQ